MNSRPLAPERVHEIIRVNHAGEYGACALYRGQQAVLGEHPHYAPLLQDMAEHEQTHRTLFEEHMRQRHVRPSALLPLWGLLGYGLGALSARVSPQAAMACTVAVEDAIDQHYQSQTQELHDQEPTLSETIHRCHQDEQHHRDMGLAQGAQNMRGYTLFYHMVRCATQLAIRIATKV